MKKQKGITLVALIITIIVMVILAGVIIASAVADGGIIDRAQGAMKEKERGELEDLIIASYEYKIGASSNVYAYLDLNATAGNIWNNLTNNGFTLKDGSGNEYTSDTNFVDGQKDENGEIDEIEINAEGKHGEYGGTVTEEGLQNLVPIGGQNQPPKNENEDDDGEDNIVGEGLELQISQNYNVITDVVTLTITPKVTEAFFTENEAAKEVGNALGLGEITSLNELDYKLYNFLTTIDGMPFYKGNIVNSFEELVAEIFSEMENPEPTIQEVALYLFENVGWEYETVQEFAAAIYAPTSVELAISKDEGEWTDITDKSKWSGKSGTYTVRENGTYAIKVELDKKATTTDSIEVSDIGVGTWIDNGDGTYSKGDTTIEIGKTTLTNEEVKTKFGIYEDTEYEGKWVVIGVVDNKIKLVTAENAGEDVTLGPDDPRATEALDSSATDFEKTVWSYIHSIETLDFAAKRATGIESAVSIKRQDIYGVIGTEGITHTTGNIVSYYNPKTSTRYYRDGYGNEMDLGKESRTYIGENGEVIIVELEDDEITIPLDHYSPYYLNDAQKYKCNKFINTNDSFWYADFMVGETGCCTYSWSSQSGKSLLSSWLAFSSNGRQSQGDTMGVRAVITF